MTTCMRANSFVDHGSHGYRPKTWANTEDYKSEVAVPVMRAIDQMPQVWQDLIREFDYIDVYRAWKRGLSPATVRDNAARNGGRFVL